MASCPLVLSKNNNDLLYCAINKKQLVAYVLFRYRKEKNSIVLVHVCVDDRMHSLGIGTALINTIVSEYPNAYYIEARCRRDYSLAEPYGNSFAFDSYVSQINCAITENNGDDGERCLGARATSLLD